MPNLIRVARLVYLVLLVLAVARPAVAQIYSWKDANGNIVLSDKAPGGKVRSYQTPHRSAPFRTTRPAEGAFKDRYDRLIVQHAASYAVSADLVRAVVQVESGFNPYARSAKGAMGLMQLMPATAIEMGVVNPYDPDQNIRGGVAYLRVLLNRYSNDVSKALAAYNAGPGTVDRYGSQVPYPETRDYVAAVRQRSSGDVPVTASGVAVQPTPRGPAATGHGTKAAAVAARTATAPPRPIYKTIEIIDGRPVAKYTDSRPAIGPYQVVPRR
jgi:hypothetical protein